MLKNFDEILEQIKSEKIKTIAVAMADDSDVLKALEKARSMGLSKAVLTGNTENILNRMSDLGIDKNDYEIVDTTNELESVQAAVAEVKKGKASVLMKGLCSTSTFLKGVLDKIRSGVVGRWGGRMSYCCKVKGL